MGSQIDISNYVAASGLASKRSRVVYLAIAAFSALVSSGMLNSSPQAPRQQQIQLAQDVLNWHDHLASGDRPEFTGSSTDSTEAGADFDNAKKFYDQHKTLFEDLSRAERFLEPVIAEGLFRRQVVKLPFLGISLDSHNLSLLSGIVFSILLLVFRFSLYREQENLEIFFAAAREQGASSQCYDLMQMNQVLFIPKSNWRQSQKTTLDPKSNAKPRSPRWLMTTWNKLPLLIFIAPILLHLLPVRDALVTLLACEPAPPTEFIIHICNVALLLLFIGPLTVSCYGMSRRMDRHWKDQRDLIDSAEASTEKAVSGKWNYTATDNHGDYSGAADFSTGVSGHLEIKGTREWHKSTSGDVDERHIKWHSDQVLINHGRIMFDFHVDEPGKESRRIWCVLKETQDGMRGEHTHLSGERIGEVHFFREGQNPRNSTSST